MKQWTEEVEVVVLVGCIMRMYFNGEDTLLFSLDYVFDYVNILGLKATATEAIN